MELADFYTLSDRAILQDRGSYQIIGGGAGSGLLVGAAGLSELLAAFDGATPTSEVLQRLERCGASAVWANELIANLVEHEILLPHGERPHQQRTAKRFSHLFLEMTSRCNLRCRHCYMEGGLARKDELRLYQWLDLVEEFAAMGGSSLTLSGGESLLYPSWPVIARHGAARGLQLSLMTNGAYLDQRALNLLMKLHVGIGLGLDGITAQSHNTNRGPKSFDQTMAAFRLVAQNGYQHNTTVCFTPMRFNVYDLPAMIEWMLEMCLPRLYVSLLEERGRAGVFRDKLFLTSDQRVWLLQYLYQRSCELVGLLEIEVTHHTEIFRRLLSDFDEHAQKPRGTIRVTSDGQVYLSAYMGATDHCVGRAGEELLGTMLRSDRAREILEALEDRAAKIPQCSTCIYKGICQGGVAVLAHSRFGSFLVPDEYCEARIALFDSAITRIATERDTEG
jgi:radical SAM protein with 4Fe4S-binding SPASM domain